jgi:hypothetical protein
MRGLICVGSTELAAVMMMVKPLQTLPAASIIVFNNSMHLKKIVTISSN